MVSRKISRRSPRESYSFTFRLRNGRELPDGSRYKIEQQEGVYRLTIKEVWDIDGGDYTVVVSNPFGSDSATAALKVQAPPVIEKEPGHIVVPDGELVRLKIYFSGTPKFDFNLSVNRNDIGPDHPNIKMVEFDDHVLITIKSVHSPDTGRYELTVSNESGQATCGWTVNVTGLPGPPTGPLIITDLNQHQATLHWKLPKEDGGSRITNYVVEKRDRAKDEWIVAASYVKVSACFHAFEPAIPDRPRFRTPNSPSKAYSRITNTNSAFRPSTKMDKARR